MPDLIEDEIIDIKDSILENGFKDGIKEIINSGINYGKSVIGIVTGNFENTSQISLAVKKGGILDKTSDLLDYAINLANKKEVINNTTAKLIKKGKNTIIDTISNKIEETLTNQIKSVEKLEKYCIEWEQAYKDKDISKMDKAYRNINNYISKTIPLEKILNNARKIENIHKLIKNNGNNFEISENEMELSKKLIY